MAIGVEKAAETSREWQMGCAKILFVGRFIYFKGTTIAIRAFAEFVRLGGVGRLTLVGEGSGEAHARALAERLGIDQLLDWVPWVDQRELARIYSSHHIFIFPSLHDSSGNVVIEAMSHGLPVVCLNLGGPAQIVTKESGIVVPVFGETANAVSARMGWHMKQLLDSQQKLKQLSDGALDRAREFLWPNRVRCALEDVQRVFPTEPACAPSESDK